MKEVPDDGGGEGEEGQPQDDGHPHGCADQIVDDNDNKAETSPVDDHTSFLLKCKRQQSQQRVAVSYMVDTYSDVRSRGFLVYVVKKYIILS